MKRKRTPWPRWAKLTRNLFLFLLLALTVWTQLGRPLPYGAALRRAARQYLMPKMEHHAEISQLYWLGSIRADWTEGAAMLSIPVEPLHTRFFHYPIVEPIPLTKGTNLLASPWTASRTPDLTGICAIYIAVFPPEDSVTATLTLHNDDAAYTADAEREGEIFVFYIRPEPDENGVTTIKPTWHGAEERAYELTFYNESGEEVTAP